MNIQQMIESTMMGGNYRGQIEIGMNPDGLWVLTYKLHGGDWGGGLLIRRWWGDTLDTVARNMMEHGQGMI